MSIAHTLMLILLLIHKQNFVTLPVLIWANYSPWRSLHYNNYENCFTLELVHPYVSLLFVFCIIKTFFKKWDIFHSNALFSGSLPKMKNFSAEHHIFRILPKMRKISAKHPIFGIFAQIEKIFSYTLSFGSFAQNKNFSSKTPHFRIFAQIWENF